MEANNKLFLKGLNELRAVAALAVLVSHIELFKFRDHLSYSFLNNQYLRYFFNDLGKNAVYLFFVLSGFLITYLIIKEKEKFNFFDFKKFYARRIFRIWPLYYLIMLISFLMIPFLDHNFSIFRLNDYFHMKIQDTNYASFESLFYYFGFLSNYGLNDGIAIVGASQSWSVSIEEQFYLFWPVILLIFFRKFKILSLVGLILLLIAINLFFDVRFLRIFQFEHLFIGCLGALLVNTKFFLSFKESLNNRYLYFLNIIFIVILLFTPVFGYYIQKIVISTLYLTLIVLTINNTFYFRSKLFNELGKISYGIYMYHPFVMFLIFPFVEKFIPGKIGVFLFSYIFIIIFTSIISYLSYYYLEKKFLLFKEKYSKL